MEIIFYYIDFWNKTTESIFRESFYTYEAAFFFGKNNISRFEETMIKNKIHKI